jgi:hypothetical protein
MFIKTIMFDNFNNQPAGLSRHTEIFMKKLVILSILTFAQFSFASALDDLLRTASEVTRQVVLKVGSPITCVTKDPWNHVSVGHGATNAIASAEAVSKCGIFSDCTANMVCENTSLIRTGLSGGRGSNSNANTTTTVVERCSSYEHQQLIDLQQKYNKLNSDYSTVYYRLQALTEQINSNSETSYAGVTAACSHAFFLTDDKILKSQCIDFASKHKVTSEVLSPCGSSFFLSSESHDRLNCIKNSVPQK